MDEGLSKAVLKVFVELYEQGLVYKDKRLVNWDPQFQSAISDLEVEPIEKTGTFKWARGDKDKEGNPVAFDRAASPSCWRRSRAATCTISTTRWSA